jgi:hypothetical protein
VIIVVSSTRTGKTMKKFTKLLMIVSLFAAWETTGAEGSSENKNVSPPAFNKPHSVVMDMWSYGSKKYEDYVKVFNGTLQTNISFNVWGFDKKAERWVLIGTAALKKAGDVVEIDSPVNGELDKFRWFVIQSLDELDFTVQTVINRNDILITVYNK